MNSGLWEQITVLRTQYEERDLCIVDVLNHGCFERARSAPLGRTPRYRTAASHGHRG